MYLSHIFANCCTLGSAEIWLSLASLPVILTGDFWKIHFQRADLELILQIHQENRREDETTHKLFMGYNVLQHGDQFLLRF